MDSEIVFKSMVSYILLKDNKLSKEAVKEIICVADIRHFVNSGRTICDIFVNGREYKFNNKILDKVWGDIEKEFEEFDLFLSMSDKDCLDFAINMHGIDCLPRFFNKIEM
jgi:hypothetical protein